MKADPAAQRALLDLQGLDARIDQLRHQRAALPEVVEITSLEQSRRELVDRARDAQIVVDDLTVAQTKADADVEQVKARRVRDQDRIDQGLITNPKDLEHMQHELETLQRRVSVLEDAELEVMEQLESAQSSLEELRDRVSATDTRLSDVTAVHEEKTAEIDRQVTAATQEREPVAAGLPEDLLALYDRLRQSKGGVGAAELRARQCGGCRLTLDNAELSRIRSEPEDLVVRCEECQRILVRTAESGL